MKVLALDVGARRIGLAVGDTEGRLPLPLGALERRSPEADLAALEEVARSQGAQRLVVGLPLSLDGSLGPQAREVQAFAEPLARRLGLPLELWDERLTTVEAERRLRELSPPATRRSEGRPSREGRRKQARGQRDGTPRPSREGRGGPRDALAAALILEGYLLRQQRGPAEAPGDASSCGP